MKKRKVLFTAVMVLAGLQLLSGCGKTEASANDTVVLRYAYASNSQPVIDSMKKFGELVEEKTDGKVQIILYLPFRIFLIMKNIFLK